MELIVVTRNYDYYDESYTQVLGVCETEATADALIEKDKKERSHPLMDTEELVAAMDMYFSQTEKISIEEKRTPKNGGWLKKFDRNQLNKGRQEIYDELVDAAGDMNFYRFYTEYSVDDEHMRCLLMRFLVPEFMKFTDEQIVELQSFYFQSEDPDRVRYHKNRFEVLK